MGRAAGAETATPQKGPPVSVQPVLRDLPALPARSGSPDGTVAYPDLGCSSAGGKVIAGATVLGVCTWWETPRARNSRQDTEPGEPRGQGGAAGQAQTGRDGWLRKAPSPTGHLPAQTLPDHTLSAHSARQWPALGPVLSV